MFFPYIALYGKKAFNSQKTISFYSNQREKDKIGGRERERVRERNGPGGRFRLRTFIS